MNEIMERARSYISTVRWQFAKTMPETPHEYTVSKWNPNLRDEFEWFVNAIRQHGKGERFFNKTFMYFAIDGKKYWTMGAPIKETILINRTDIE